MSELSKLSELSELSEPSEVLERSEVSKVSEGIGGCQSGLGLFEVSEGTTACGCLG